MAELVDKKRFSEAANVAMDNIPKMSVGVRDHARDTIRENFQHLDEDTQKRAIEEGIVGTDQSS